ncbi:hypothetical protein SLEP1_g4811 [Rubroshorea leprosula]|nr:hypothetical protein SLEP1_g4811 [Rubroshorea leprosula]
MCIDYTNLNEACSKDCHPLPSIEELVEAAFENERLSLLDAYSRYHQVHMAPEDEVKTSFYAGDEIYYYVMMPFRLKNVGATYQKMVTIVFRAQIDRNLEVYIDAIIEGIKVNPEKIKAIEEMKPLKSVKDVQRLTGRGEEGEILYLYLGISDAAISSVLVREVRKQQRPVYYTSKVLQGAELRYSIAEKAALAVATTARKLRPYFQAHPIVILTDQPLRQILQKLECSGRLIKWQVESKVMEVSIDPETPSWTDPIKAYLRDGTVPNDKPEEMQLRKKASQCTLVDGVLYKKSYSLHLLHCLTPYEIEYTLRKVHEGVCGNHIGARTMAHKVLRQGYYWPIMQEDAKKYVQKCQKCQFFAHLTHQPTEELTTLVAPWPFAQWGIDLLGPFIKGTRGVTHLVITIDCFIKWVEARPLSSLTSRKIEDFVFSSIIFRYEIPNQVVADNELQFNCTSFKDFCSNYRIKLVFTSVYHPKANKMVESINKAILKWIKPRLDQVKAKWVDKLNNVL